MNLKAKIEQIRGLIRKAKYEEAFQMTGEILAEVENPFIKKSLTLTEGRYNNHKRKELHVGTRDDSELNSIIHTFYDQLTELDEIVANENEQEYNEIGKRIMLRIFESFEEIEKEDDRHREFLKEYEKGNPVEHRFPDYRLIELDEKFKEIAHFFVREQKASIFIIQRHFQVGYNRASRIMEALEAKEIVSSVEGQKGRSVLVNDENELKIIFDSLIKIEEGEGKYIEFFIEKYDPQKRQEENKFNQEETSTLIRRYFPTLEGTINGFKLKKVGSNALTGFNLIKVILTLEPLPLDYYDIWFDPSNEDSIKSGFMEIGKFLWGLPVIGVTFVGQDSEYEGTDENDVVVEFFTIAKLPKELLDHVDPDDGIWK